MESGFIKQHLLSKPFPQQAVFKDGEPQCHISFTPFPNCNRRTLKAVYPHFSQAKRRFVERKSLSSCENLNREELKSAMEEAKRAYKTMREIQEQLNQAYQELMLLNSHFS